MNGYHRFGDYLIVVCFGCCGMIGLLVWVPFVGLRLGKSNIQEFHQPIWGLGMRVEASCFGIPW